MTAKKQEKKERRKRKGDDFYFLKTFDPPRFHRLESETPSNSIVALWRGLQVQAKESFYGLSTIFFPVKTGGLQKKEIKERKKKNETKILN